MAKLVKSNTIKFTDYLFKYDVNTFKRNIDKYNVHVELNSNILDSFKDKSLSMDKVFNKHKSHNENIFTFKYKEDTIRIYYCHPLVCILYVDGNTVYELMRIFYKSYTGQFIIKSLISNKIDIDFDEYYYRKKYSFVDFFQSVFNMTIDEVLDNLLKEFNIKINHLWYEEIHSRKKQENRSTYNILKAYYKRILNYPDDDRYCYVNYKSITFDLYKEYKQKIIDFIGDNPFMYFKQINDTDDWIVNKHMYALCIKELKLNNFINLPYTSYSKQEVLDVLKEKIDKLNDVYNYEHDIKLHQSLKQFKEDIIKNTYEELR